MQQNPKKKRAAAAAELCTMHDRITEKGPNSANFFATKLCLKNGHEHQVNLIKRKGSGMTFSHLSIGIDSKPIVWDSSVVFPDNFLELSKCLTI